jgi:hypothetical protein
MGKRLEILLALQADLMAIRTANGYQTEIGSNVVYWHDTDFEYGESVLEFRDTIEEMFQTNHPYEKTLTVELSAIQSTDNPLTVSSQVLEDLEKVIDRFTVQGGRATIVSNEKTTETKGKKNLKIKVKVKIIYREILP